MVVTIITLALIATISTYLLIRNSLKYRKWSSDVQGQLQDKMAETIRLHQQLNSYKKLHEEQKKRISELEDEITKESYLMTDEDLMEDIEDMLDEDDIPF